jgi:hypothetical protein
MRVSWRSALVVHSTRKRSHAALLIPLALIVIDGGLRIWWAESIPGGLLSAAGAVFWFVLEIRGHGVRSWIDEEVKPRKGEGKGGLVAGTLSVRRTTAGVNLLRSATKRYLPKSIPGLERRGC